MRILLVEDDEALAQAVGSYLRSKAFLIDSVPSLAQARACLAGASYAAVLLDLHLADGDGLALMPTLRRLAQPPVTIVLTARDQVSDRIRGLDAGADDYLVKPYDPEELLARLRAVSRRGGGMQAGQDAVLRMGTLEIDLAREMVRDAGRTLLLTPRNGRCCACSRPSRSVCTRASICSMRSTASMPRPTATRWKCSSAGCAASSGATAS